MFKNNNRYKNIVDHIISKSDVFEVNYYPEWIYKKRISINVINTFAKNLWRYIFSQLKLTLWREKNIAWGAF